MSYKARGGSGYNTRNRRSNRSKKVGGRSQTEKSAEAYRQWVYSQNPDARKLSDPEVVRIKSELGHYDGLFKQVSPKIRSVLLEKTDNVFNLDTYPYLKKSVVSMTPLEKVQTALFNGSEEHFMVLSAKKAKEVLDCDIGFEALEQKKRNVALAEDGGLYQWYGFNKDNDWEPLTDLFNIGKQISTQDAEYLLKHGKLVYK